MLGCGHMTATISPSQPRSTVLFTQYPFASPDPMKRGLIDARVTVLGQECSQRSEAITLKPGALFQTVHSSTAPSETLKLELKLH